MPAPCCWGPRIGLIERFAGCFKDGLAGDRIVPDLSTLVGQRVLGIALGYEDLVDHDQRRRDPVMGWCLGGSRRGTAGARPWPDGHSDDKPLWWFVR
jgi:hypothetical protein